MIKRKRERNGRKVGENVMEMDIGAGRVHQFDEGGEEQGQPMEREDKVRLR